MDLIPKTINYCWFGGNPMPELIQNCIKSWDIYLPEYKKVLWNENSFDVESHQFTREAYKCKKYAFVSDYVRLYALYNYGGLYMDTDVEVLKNLDEFLKYPAFSGFENPSFIPTGIMGSISKHPWVKRFLDYYKDRGFYNNDGSMDLKANVRFMTQISENEFGLRRNNEFQILKNDVYIFPNDYFCPKIWKTKEIVLTENTHTIHYFTGTWAK
ncbi:glycosyltransferase family 32 protein [Anaerovorax odorimutans]|uniref:glycosyltransferase family 32 protein n=1 Tax=Anaerovorax odorimutans TaxID=109327 RepID=UPI00041E2AF7|nr:glycosyltransferase [Anaerovorax odorimutans]